MTFFDDVLCRSIRSLEEHVILSSYAVALRALETCSDRAEARACIERLVDDRLCRVLLRGAPFSPVDVVRASLREHANHHLHHLFAEFGQPEPTSRRKACEVARVLEGVAFAEHRRLAPDEVVLSAAMSALVILFFWQATVAWGCIALGACGVSFVTGYVLRRILPYVFRRRREQLFLSEEQEQQGEEAKG